MFETLESQIAEKDRQEKVEADKSHNWPANPPLPDALTNEQLNALRQAAITCGRPLTDDEREIVLYGKLQQKWRYGFPIKQTSLTEEKLQQLRDAALSQAK